MILIRVRRARGTPRAGFLRCDQSPPEPFGNRCETSQWPILDGGTDGSNPSPSSAESVANLTPSIRAPKISCRHQFAAAVTAPRRQPRRDRPRAKLQEIKARLRLRMHLEKLLNTIYMGAAGIRPGRQSKWPAQLPAGTRFLRLWDQYQAARPVPRSLHRGRRQEPALAKAGDDRRDAHVLATACVPIGTPFGVCRTTSQ